MQLAKIIQLPDTLATTEKAAFLQDLIVYLHDELEEAESVPVQRAFGFIGTTGAIAAAWSMCGLGMVAPFIAVPGVIIVASMTILSGATLAKDVIESPEIIDLQKRLAHVLESKEIDQWVKLWEEVGTESFAKRLHYSCMGGFTSKGAFRHKSGSHPFDVAALFGGSKPAKPWEQVGMNTKLNAIETPAPVVSPTELPLPQPVQMERTLAPTAIQAPLYSQLAKQIARSAYTLILDNPLECRAVFGAQRTGKSYLLAVASQELHRQGTKIYHINLGSYGTEEDIYWSHCARSVRGDISSMRAYETNQLIEKAIAVVDEFYSQEDAILIFDEWIYAGKKNNAHAKALQPLIDLVADKAGVLTQTGVKRSKAIWTVAPEFVAGTVIDSAKVIKSFSLLYVTIAPGRTVNWTNPNTGKVKPVKFDTSLFNQIANNYEIETPTERFSVDRICFIDNEWIEVGDLPPLDPSLRPANPAAVIQSATTIQATAPTQIQLDYSEEDKQQAQTRMVEALQQTSQHTLWEFVRDELGVEDADETKELLEAIADLIFDHDLTSLRQKFRLNSKRGIRYSYGGYSKKVAQVHRYTNNMCCCCHANKSEQAHHSRYLGANDEPGVNLFPVCLKCHDSLCHSKENWLIEGIWNSHNTPAWESRLKLEFQFAISQDSKGGSGNG